MTDVVLVTGRNMPYGPEDESPLLARALHDRGVDAIVEPWGTPASVDAPLVVIRTTWDYTFVLEEFMAWLRSTAATTTVVNPLSIIEWNHHKSYLLDLAYAAVPMIDTALVERGSDDATLLALLEEHAGDVVIKPAVSVGAIGTALAAADAPEAIDHLRELTRVGDALVQPYEPGITDGEVSLMYFGGEFSHAVKKTPAAGDYRVQTFHGGVNTSYRPNDDELAVGAAALRAVEGELAYARVDVVTAALGPVVMELELIEPQLFLEFDDAAARYADYLVTRLG